MKQICNSNLKCILTLLMFLYMGLSMLAQEREIRGLVRDAYGYPLQGIYVSVPDGEFSTITDESGSFRIWVNEDSGSLMFSFIGYKETTVQITPDVNDLEIVLQEAWIPFHERKVKIAYGEDDPGDITSAVSVIYSEELNKSVHHNLQNALIGRLNGLTAFPNNFEPGNSGFSMFVRGLKSTSPNHQPLILVDNVERDLSQLSPNEIESVTLLKDAAAVALYGSRAANGVILVTTRRGEINKRAVTVDAQYSLQETMNLRKNLNSYNFARLYNRARELDGNTPFYSGEAIEGYRRTVELHPDADPYRYPNVDFIDEFINRFANQQKVDITMTGGNQSARYFSFIGYLNQDGVFKYGNENSDYNTNTNYKRFNFRSNVDVTVSEMVTAYLDMAGRIELRNYPGSSAYEIFNSITTTPSNAYPVFNPDGSLGGTSTYRNNPYGLIAQSGYTQTNRRIFDAAVGFKIDFDQWIQGLIFDGRAGFDYNNFKNRGLSREFRVYEYIHDSDQYVGYGTDQYNDFANVVTDQGFYRQAFGRGQLNYQRHFRDVHQFSAMGFFDLSQRSFPFNNPSYKHLAFGIRTRYNYDRRYYLELVASATASEAFASGERLGVFPAASAGWVLSEEGFISDIESIDFLRVRASYGKSGLERPYGDDQNYRFLHLDDWATSGIPGYAFGNPGRHYDGVALTGLGNEKLRWEEANKTNIGLDLELLNRRVYFTSDLFYEERTGIWVIPRGWIPDSYGAPLPFENAGSTESSGLELMLGFTGETNDFEYDIRGMAAYSRSKILDLKEGPQFWDYKYSAGKSIGEIWGLVSQGFFGEDVENYPTQSFGTVRPGDIRYLDYNDDGVVNADDIIALGKTWFPSWVYSLNTYLKYRSFDFSMLWQGMTDRHVANPRMVLPFADGNATQEAFNAWTPETAETANYPRLTVSNYQNNSQMSDFWVVDASFLRLKSLEFGYQLPDAVVQRAGFARLRVYLNGYNLLTVSDVGFDPESPAAGIWQYPPSRIYTVGLNVSF